MLLLTISMNTLIITSLLTTAFACASTATKRASLNDEPSSVPKQNSKRPSPDKTQKPSKSSLSNGIVSSEILDISSEPIESEDVLTECFGKQVSKRPYRHHLKHNFDANLMKRPEILNCNFARRCCWNNERLKAEDIDWMIGSGRVDKNAVQECFGTRKIPGGKFLVLTPDSRISHPAEALWFSCSIECAKKVTFSARYWGKNGSLFVCTRSSFAFTLDQRRCHALDGRYHKTTIELQGDKYFDILLSAMIAEDGILAVDDITIKLERCDKSTIVATSAARKEEQRRSDESAKRRVEQPLPSNKPTVATITTASTTKATTLRPKPAAALNSELKDVCRKISCNFEYGNACNWKPLIYDRNGSAIPGWKIASSRYGNRDTGVPRPAKATSYYIATRLPPHQHATLGLLLPKSERMSLIISFYYYEATYDAQVKLCINRVTDCVFYSPKGVVYQHRGWKEMQVQIKGYISKLYFVAENYGKVKGAAGIDEVRLLDPLTSRRLC